MKTFNKSEQFNINSPCNFHAVQFHGPIKKQITKFSDAIASATLLPHAEAI